MPSATFYLAQTLFDLALRRRPAPADGLRRSIRSTGSSPTRNICWARRACPRASATRASRTSKRSSQRIRRTLAPAARQAITGTLAKHGNKSAAAKRLHPADAAIAADAEALYDAGLIAGRLGQAQNQDAAWRRLRKEFPNHSLAHQASLELARASFKKKSWADAATQGKAASASSDDAVRAEGLLLMGESELKLNRFKDAAKSFEVGAVKNVEAADRYRALAGLGLAREQLEELRAALAAYESVASKLPTRRCGLGAQPGGRGEGAAQQIAHERRQALVTSRPLAVVLVASMVALPFRRRRRTSCRWFRRRLT